MTGGVGNSVDCHQTVETTETATQSSTHSRSSNSSSLSSLERATEFVTNWCSGGRIVVELSTIQCTSSSTTKTTETNLMRPVSTSRRNMTAPTPSRCTRSRSVERLPKDSRMTSGGVEQPPSDAEVQQQYEYQHHRSVSDFLYTQTSTVATTASEDESSVSSSGGDNNNTNIHPFPTFPRFPVEANHDKNCWSEPPISLFTVRGPRYFQDSKKVASGPSLLQPRGTDLFLIPPKKNSKHQPSSTPDDMHLENLAHRIMGGNLRKKPTLAIYFCFPWGYMNLYFEIPEHLAVFLQPQQHPSDTMTTMMASIDADPQLTTAEKTFAKWLVGDAEYKNERLKLIPYVAAGPWAVRNMVTGRPAIIGKKLPVTYHLHNNTQDGDSSSPLPPLLSVTLDVGSSSNAAKRIVSVCRRYMSALTVDLGFVIQANTDQELPEQMLATIRVHGPEPLQATTIHQPQCESSTSL